MIFKYILIASIISLHSNSKDISKLKASNSTVVQIQKMLLPKAIVIEEKKFRSLKFSTASIDTSLRLGCAFELAKESVYDNAIFIPKASSIIVPGIDDKNRFGFYFLNRTYSYFIHAKATDIQKAYGKIKIDGIDFYFVRSGNKYSLSLESSRDKLISKNFRFKEVKLVKNTISDQNSLKLQNATDHFVVSALGGLSQYLTKFRVEMYKAKVSQFDDLGLRSITALKRCHKVYSRSGDVKLAKAFAKAKEELKKTITLPKKPE